VKAGYTYDYAHRPATLDVEGWAAERSFPRS
jgi:hypothetical protein